MGTPVLTARDAELLRQVRDGLRELADHDVPAVRGPARLALAEVEQILNSQMIDYSLYSHSLTLEGP